jgi:zinc transporter ZupT
MEVFLLTVAASAAALAGGYTAMRSRSWLDLALALTSGLVLGLVTFDLLPAIFGIVHSENFDPAWPMIAMTAGFLLFHIFEGFVSLHQADEGQYGPHRHPQLGTARAVALTGHSFLDGLSIGVGFQASPTVGAAVAIAVIGHRFADGFDTAAFMMFNNNKLAQIKKWLALVVAMPIIGGLASQAFTLSQQALAVYLGFFAGFILYIAASNIMPQAHSVKFSTKSVGLTVLGAAAMFAITRFV